MFCFGKAGFIVLVQVEVTYGQKKVRRLEMPRGKAADGALYWVKRYGGYGFEGG